jgi:mannose-6-phosphate isomerase-like protein (cupin superfamily)
MFIFLDEDFSYINRYRIEIKVFDSLRNFPKSNFTRFVICHGKVQSKNISGSGYINASINDELTVDGHGAVIELLGYNMTEESITVVNPRVPGNLSYIDGCSNSCTIPPPRNGEPCLNYLYFPKGINQTFHTHPSVRIGMILEGEGWADVEDKKYKLSKGNIFLLDRFTNHRFRTDNSSMSLIAFHPDSEDGPKDEKNPMISRTYISK